MQWALVDGDGMVQNLIVYDGTSDYSPPEGITLEQVSDWVTQGMWHDAPEPIAPSPTQSQLLAALAEHRYAICNGGTKVNNIPIKTDSESRGDLMAAFVMATASPSYTVKWKAGDGNFHPLDAVTIISIANAVAAFVQKCFDSEAAIAANISQYATAEQAVAAFDSAMAS